MKSPQLLHLRSLFYSILCLGLVFISACQKPVDPTQKLELFLQEIQELEQTISVLETSLNQNASFTREQQDESKYLLEQLMQMETEMNLLSEQHQLDQQLLAQTQANIQAAKQQIWDSFYGNYNLLANDLNALGQTADSLENLSQNQNREIRQLKEQLARKSQSQAELRVEKLQTLTVKGNRTKVGVSFLDRRFDSLKVNFELLWPEPSHAKVDIYLLCQNEAKEFMDWGASQGVYQYWNQSVPYVDKITASPNANTASMLLVADAAQKLEKGIYTVSLLANQKLIGQTRFELGW